MLVSMALQSLGRKTPARVLTDPTLRKRRKTFLVFRFLWSLSYSAKRGEGLAHLVLGTALTGMKGLEIPQNILASKRRHNDFSGASQFF